MPERLRSFIIGPKEENGSVVCKPVLCVAFSVLIIAKFVSSPLLSIPAAQSVKLPLYKPHDVRKRKVKLSRIGRTIAQAVSRRLPTAAARVQTWF
jgi:hypothetical protein